MGNIFAIIWAKNIAFNFFPVSPLSVSGQERILLCCSLTFISFLIYWALKSMKFLIVIKSTWIRFLSLSFEYFYLELFENNDTKKNFK